MSGFVSMFWVTKSCVAVVWGIENFEGEGKSMRNRSSLVTAEVTEMLRYEEKGDAKTEWNAGFISL